MKKILFLLSVSCLVSCETVNRSIKDISADFGNVPREVILMDYNGDTLEKFNTNYIFSDSGSSIFFEDEHHKRIGLSCGIIVCKEK